MGSEESIEELQENEVNALKAIFDDAVVDVRLDDVWKVRRAPELHIRLLPQQSDEEKEAHVAVTLAVKCAATYPHVIPEIKLIDPKGLSDTVLQSLKNDLGRLAEELKGQEMLYPLAEMTQHFLYKHNVPASLSFYEQMLIQKQKEAETIAAEERRKREILLRQRELEVQQIEEEVEKRKTFIHQQENVARVRFEDEEEHDVADDEEDDQWSVIDRQPLTGGRERTSSMQTLRSRSVDSAEGIVSTLSKNKGVVNLEMKSGRIVKLQIIKASTGRRKGGSFLHYALDVERDNALVVLSEWIFRWRPKKAKKINSQLFENLKEESGKYFRFLDALDMEMQSLSKLRHAAIVRYHSWKYGFEKDHVCAYVIRDYVHGTSVTSMLKEHAPFSVDQCKLLALNVLDGLFYLHTNDVVHRNVKTSSVFFTHTGKFVLTDHALVKRLEEIYRFTQSQTGEMISSQRGGKKTDLLYFGITVCSAVLGTVIEEEIHDVPVSVPEEMKDFLGKILCRYDKDRQTAEQLRQHSFIARQTPTDAPYVIPTEVEKGFYKDLPVETADYHISDTAWQLATSSLPLPSESRIHREFEIMEFCGRGGYGDVLKVRNVLDGRLYAIKRIPLTETKEKLNKRILREVQLLSRLNHENVVRYYNSWTETVAPGNEGSQDASSTGTALTSTTDKKTGKPAGFVDSVGFFADNIEDNAPPPVEGSVEWLDNEGENDEKAQFSAGSGQDMDIFGAVYPQNVHELSDSSEDIVFGKSGDDTTASEHEAEVIASPRPLATTSSKSPSPNVVLFIQMEYCENSTLRTCIDQGLFRDQERVWRLFRELVEGLGHIHQQGIIHRDLKPANIFIDSRDHVRIGDFGLATHTLMSKASTFADNLSDMAHSLMENSTDEMSRTGRVGTAMYVSPELVENNAKATYSQKVDMYSLGISFFEMCYRPFATGMERTFVLNGVRKYPVQLPAGFDTESLQRQAAVVKWLCEHDPRKRPNAVELLQSDLMPPPKIEDAEVNEIIRVTVQNPQSKTYKRLMESLFAQRTSAVTDLTYDLDVRKGSGNGKFALAFEFVEQRALHVFHLHGAVRLFTPFLMPSLKNVCPKDAVVSLMDTNGNIVVLPYDHRVPFARYVARNSVTSMKKFSIDRVFRERRITSAHPKELFECSFDIVTSLADSQIPDAECVTVISDLINELPGMAGHAHHLWVNHTDFLRALFVSTGVAEEKLDAALDWLCDMRAESVSKVQAKKSFAQLCDFTEHGYEFLEKFLASEGTFSQITGVVRTIIKRKGPAGALAKKALQECESFLLIVERLGCTFPVTVSFGLADRVVRSGIVFHISQGPSPQRGKTSRPEILAIGGRYSSLVQQFVSERTSREADFRPVIVTGVSLAYERLVAATLASDEFAQPRATDVFICAVGAGAGAMMKEQMTILRDLRAVGIKADLFLEPIEILEDIQNFCRVIGSHLMVIKDAACTVRFLEKEKIFEKKFSFLPEAVEWISQKMSPPSTVRGAESTENPSSTRNALPLEGASVQFSSATRPKAKVTFHTSDRISGRDRKRHSTHIFTVLETVFTAFAAATTVEVLAVDLPGQVLKWLPSHMSVSPDGRICFEEWAALCDRFPKHRKYLKQLCDELVDQSYCAKTRLILFSILDDVYRYVT